VADFSLSHGTFLGQQVFFAGRVTTVLQMVGWASRNLENILWFSFVSTVIFVTFASYGHRISS